MNSILLALATNLMRLFETCMADLALYYESYWMLSIHRLTQNLLLNIEQNWNLQQTSPGQIRILQPRLVSQASKG